MSSLSSLIPCAGSHVLESKENCLKKGVKFCGGCQLVAYCSVACQKTHWPQHKLDCKNNISLDSWTPDWFSEGRLPEFLSPVPSKTDGQVVDNALKFLWGNMPALDMLALHKNEGLDYKQELSLSFAECGDLRNVVKTVNTIPDACTAPVSIHVNDQDIDVIIRAIALLVLLLPGSSIECSIHLWFSAFITDDHVTEIDQKVVPLIQAVVDKISGNSADQMLAATLSLSDSSLRIILRKWQWERVLHTLKRRLALDVARESYAGIVLHRKDQLQRFLHWEQGTRRLAKLRFRENGTLLPFGSTSDKFNRPNSTLFDIDGQWLQPDSADPLRGHWWEDIEKALISVGKPANDLYGHLFIHMFQQFQQFALKCKTRSIGFTVTSSNFEDLVQCIPNYRFDRIEVSNVMVVNHLGAGRSLRSLGPFLRDTKHSSIIALFNATQPLDKIEVIKGQRASVQKLKEYIPISRLPSGLNDPELSRQVDLGDIFLPYEDWLAKYWKAAEIDKQVAELDYEVRESNKVVPEWPWKFEPGEDVAQARHRLLRLLNSRCTGGERYFEWVHKRRA